MKLRHQLIGVVLLFAATACSGWPMVFTHDGELFTPVRGNPEQWPEARVQGMAIPGRDGVVGEPLTVPTLDFESVSVRVNERAALSVRPDQPPRDRRPSTCGCGRPPLRRYRVEIGR